MMSLIVMSAVLGSAFAQHQFRKPCKFPTEWTAQETAFNYATNMVEHGMYVFDGANERIYRSAYDTGPNGPQAFTRILLFKEHREYNIDQRTRACTYNTIPADRTWETWGVPVNATFQRQTILGVSVGAANWITADVFALQNARAGTTSRTATFYVTNDECAPISIQVVARTADGYMNLDQSLSMTFENFVLGIENPNVFNIPDNCREAPRPGPTPGPPPSAKCTAQLQRDCSAAKSQGPTQCFTCLKSHQTDLRAAGCTPEAERLYCDPRN